MNMRTRLAVSAMSAVVVLGITAPAALAVPQSELDAASEQLATYGSELSTLQDSLSTKSEELELTSYQIGEKQKEIAQTQQDLDAAKAILGGRMRSSYKSGPTSILGVLLGSDSIEDVISRIYYMDKIARSDAEAIAEVRELEDRLLSEKSELEETEAQQQKAVDELQAQVDEFEGKVAEARAYYDELDAQVQAELAAQQEAAANAEIQAAMEVLEESEPAEQTEAQAAEDAPEQAPAQQSEAQKSQQPEPEPTSQPQEESAPEAISYGPSGGGLSTAYAAIGSPYVYGAAGPTSFDCSGLVCYAYGYARGRTTYAMIDSLKSTGSWKTSMDQLSPGDLVFTSEGHVGIYTGGGMMIHAPTPGRKVCETSIWSFIGGGTY